jgi:thiosulfate reductase cytochrome b subunit
MNTTVPSPPFTNTTIINSTAPFSTPTNLFDSKTWIENYSLLTNLPIWITLISFGVFTTALLIIYYLFFYLLLRECFLIFGATTTANRSWRIRFVARYSRTKAPFILVHSYCWINEYICYQ